MKYHALSMNIFEILQSKNDKEFIIKNEEFLNSLGEEANKRISGMLTQLLYTADEDHLKEYEAENASDDYIRDNLNALGLLQDLGTLHEDVNGMDSFGPTSHKLNVVGRELLRIKER